MSVTYIIGFNVRPEQRSRYLNLINGVLDAMRDEPMFVSATLHGDPADENRFLLHETWADHQDVLDVQLKRPYREEWHAALDELLAAPRDISMWQPMRSDYNQSRPDQASPGIELGGWNMRMLRALQQIEIALEASMSTFTRRRLLAMAATGAASAVLSACSTTGSQRPAPVQAFPSAPPPPTMRNDPSFADPQMMYAPVNDNGYDIPGVPFKKIDPRYYRQVVTDPTGEAPGTVVIDTAGHFLYVVADNGEAIRYGVGLGRAGFEWAGRGVIEWKQTWPRWFPPNEMIDRQPELEKYRARQIPGKNEWEGGMQPGVQNPLGARALYIFQDGKDTLYRLHGSPEWASIGKSVSSGCVRLINQDVIDLYGRVPDGTPIVVTNGLQMVANPIVQQPIQQDTWRL